MVELNKLFVERRFTDRIAFAHLISCRVGTRHWGFWVSVPLPPLKPVNILQFILVFRARLWSVQINSKKPLQPFPSTKGWSKGNSGWEWWATFPRSLLGATSACLWKRGQQQSGHFQSLSTCLLGLRDGYGWIFILYVMAKHLTALIRPWLWVSSRGGTLRAHPWGISAHPDCDFRLSMEMTSVTSIERDHI